MARVSLPTPTLRTARLQLRPFVGADTGTRNAASARVLEKLGFVREGTLREDCIVNGEVSDSWVYGLIRRQWRPLSGPNPDR
jgi:[ribosomal protein S5]-alanine N-acetyltransferase